MRRMRDSSEKFEPNIFSPGENSHRRLIVGRHLKDSDCGLLVESANIDGHSSQLQTLTRTVQSLEEDGLWTISPITQQTRGSDEEGDDIGEDPTACLA